MASQQPATGEPITFCAHCGKPIEADARFCRFCGKPQGDHGGSARPVETRTGAAPARSTAPSRDSGAADGLEQRLRLLFPRAAQQDDLMHIGSIAAFFMLLIGFVLGFFFSYSWLAWNFLLTAIGLILFLILRESTLAQLRERGSSNSAPRPQAPPTSAPPPPPPPPRPPVPRQ